MSSRTLYTVSQWRELTGDSEWIIRRKLRHGQLAGKKLGRKWRVYAKQEGRR